MIESFNELSLSSSIQKVKGVGPALGRLLAKKGVRTLEDALYFLPRNYEDRRRLTPIGSLESGIRSTILGTVIESREIGFGRNKRFQATLEETRPHRLGTENTPGSRRQNENSTLRPDTASGFCG